MIALYILCGVALLFALILFVPIGIELIYDGEIALSVRVLFFRYRLIPKRKKKIKLCKFSKKRYEKMIAREKKKQAKKAAKKAKKAAKKAEEKRAVAAGEKEKKSVDVPKIIRDIWEIRSLIMRTIGGFVHRIRTERVRIRLLIGSDNAAKSALIYGAAANLAVEIPEILRSQTKLRRECETAIGVDFTSETTVADVEVRFALRVADLIATGALFVFGYLKQKIKNN